MYTHFFVIQTSSLGVNNYVMVDGYVYLWTDVWNNNSNGIDVINHAKQYIFQQMQFTIEYYAKYICCENKTNQKREKNVRDG